MYVTKKLDHVLDKLDKDAFEIQGLVNKLFSNVLKQVKVLTRVKPTCPKITFLQYFTLTKAFKKVWSKSQQ